MDPIGNMFAQMKNAIQNSSKQVEVRFSNKKIAILEALKVRHLIDKFEAIKEEEQKYPNRIKITLSYLDDEPKMRRINRISKPGRRVYVGTKELPKFMRGKLDLVVSTSKGVMSGYEARKLGLGGEIICEVE